MLLLLLFLIYYCVAVVMIAWLYCGYDLITHANKIALVVDGILVEVEYGG